MAGFLMRGRYLCISDYPLRDILVPLRGDPAAAGKARAERRRRNDPPSTDVGSSADRRDRSGFRTKQVVLGRGQRSVQRLDQRAQGQLRRECADVIVVARICVGRECYAKLQG